MVLRVVYSSLSQKVPNILSSSRVALALTRTMKPQVVFVLGGPGAGKGTQCSRIVEVWREGGREDWR